MEELLGALAYLVTILGWLLVTFSAILGLGLVVSVVIAVKVWWDNREDY